MICSCEEQDDKEENIEQEEIVDRAKVTEEASIIVNDFIDDAISSESTLDPDQIADEIETLEGVESASPNESGTCISIQLSNGGSTNLLLVTMDDERMFKETTKKSSLSNTESVAEQKFGPIFPSGNGKALILAPFPFASNFSIMSDNLSSAGYSVDIYKNEEANLDRFRSSFLDDYDIVYIFTHGAQDVKPEGAFKSTAILTGEEWDNSKRSSLSFDELQGLAAISPPLSSKEYFAITPYWLRTTIGKEFPNSWIFLNACESACGLNEKSFVQTVLEMGAEGFHGWLTSISSVLAKETGQEIVKKFSSGLSFNETSDVVRNDPALQAYRFIIPIPNLDIIEVRNLVNVKNTEDPFYITDNRLVEPFTDPRDGNVYNVVRMGNQIWMAKNLKYLPDVSPPDLGSTHDPYYYVYNYYGSDTEEAILTDKYEEIGVHYNWPAAVNACPEGWHLPTNEEWEELLIYIGADPGIVKNHNLIHMCDEEALILFEPDGFHVIAGSSYVAGGDKFIILPSRAMFWTSTTTESDRAFMYDVGNIPNIFRFEYPKMHGVSIRCVRD